MIRLSKRLQAVADMVTSGYQVADIGCDHGYVAIYLIEAGISPNVIAMDINKGPLKKAREHIERAGLDTKIQTRLSDGAHALNMKEVDSVICAGMGGKLTLHIIEEAYDKMKALHEIILQPQSEIHLVRKYLRENGFHIIAEDMIYEEGKYYPILKAVPCEKCNEIQRVASDEKQQLFDYFGKLLLENKNQVLIQYLSDKEKENVAIMDSIAQIGQRTRTQSIRLKEIETQLSRIKDAFTYF